MDIKTASLEITMELLSLVEEMGERSEIAWTWTATWARTAVTGTQTDERVQPDAGPSDQGLVTAPTA